MSEHYRPNKYQYDRDKFPGHKRKSNQGRRYARDESDESDDSDEEEEDDDENFWHHYAKEVWDEATGDARDLWHNTKKDARRAKHEAHELYKHPFQELSNLTEEAAKEAYNTGKDFVEQKTHHAENDAHAFIEDLLGEKETQRISRWGKKAIDKRGGEDWWQYANRKGRHRMSPKEWKEDFKYAERQAPRVARKGAKEAEKEAEYLWKHKKKAAKDAAKGLGRTAKDTFKRLTQDQIDYFNKDADDILGHGYSERAEDLINEPWYHYTDRGSGAETIRRNKHKKRKRPNPGRDAAPGKVPKTSGRSAANLNRKTVAFVPDTFVPDTPYRVLKSVFELIYKSVLHDTFSPSELGFSPRTLREIINRSGVNSEKDFIVNVFLRDPDLMREFEDAVINFFDELSEQQTLSLRPSTRRILTNLEEDLKSHEDDTQKSESLGEIAVQLAPLFLGLKK